MTARGERRELVRGDSAERYRAGAHVSGSLTLLKSWPLSNVTSADGLPSLRVGMALTALYPAFAPRTFATVVLSDCFVFAMAALCALAFFRSSPSPIFSVLAILPV